ncbi:MAG TPA: DUF342 domain-containing protein [Firmicutes bacterium]|nr:DUF342 domain-containing protein [Bacillota bacterium]
MARKNGRPIRRITENGIEIGVMGIYVHSGNVNLSSGNLTFTGDVLVLGNVEQGARAEAGGKLIIRGNSSDSFLLGNAGVEVDGYLIKVRACAGLLGWFSAAALAPVRQLSALWQMAREKNLLDENHLKLWQHAVFDLKHIYQELELEESYFYEVPAIAAHSLTSIAFFRRHRAFPQDVLRLVGLNLEKLEDKLLKMRHEQADLILRWAWGSTLKAASSVVVTDARGCFDCGINAGGKVTIHGAVRRSWITAHDDIRIRGEVGSPLSEEEVLLQTEPEGCVYLAKAYPGVQVRFGRRTLELQEETSASCFYLDRVTYKIRKTTFREWLP